MREQGVNGQIEMAAAFDRAGFEARDVHMSDIIAGRVRLTDFKGFAACGGFSYGDVLGAGEGWAKSILFNRRARDEFAAFFQRADSFALGVCNGCQMMSNLHEIIPGTAAWPHFVRNKSEQFEARFATVEVLPSPSLFFAGMAGSRLPIAVAHGEGFAEFSDDAQRNRALVALAVRRQSRRADRALSVQPEWLAGRHHGPDDRRRPLHGIDAASGARVPQRAEFMASRGLGRRRSVAAHVPQRADCGLAERR